MSVLVITLVTGALARCAPPTPAADLVLLNARVHTLALARPSQAVAIRGGRIACAGTNAVIRRYVGPATIVRDLGGATVVPGLADAHYHLAGVGERERRLNLEGTNTKAAFLARLKAYAASARPGAWIVGSGWIETFWTPQVFPTRQDIDSITPNNPVFLSRADGHGALVNSRALALAEVTRDTPDPPGGKIEKDGGGEPTGMLVDWAQIHVYRLLPAASDAEKDSMIVVGAQRSVALGWTQVHDAGGSWSDVARLRRLYRDGRLDLRVYKAMSGPGEAADSLLAHGAIVGEFDGRLTVRTIKAMADGALGSRGARLLAPYSDDPASMGLVTVDTAAFASMLARAYARGIQVETHAIGDGGNRLVLDAYARAFATATPPAARRGRAARWRVEHAQIVAPSDFPRFQAMGIIPSMQPSHAVGDLYYADKRLGATRLAGAYAWKTFLQLGLPVAGGSDAPVERGEPMIEYHAAVTRRDLKGAAGPDSVWHPELRVSRLEGLRMLTLYPAIAAFEDDVRGSIEPGKWADLTILDRDILTIPDDQIPGTSTVLTIIGGRIVHDRLPASPARGRRSFSPPQ